VPGTGSPAVSPSGRGGPGSSQSAGPARHPAGPPRAGSRDQARALARRLITGLTLPAGGRPAVPRPVPALLGHPGQETGGGHTIDLHEFVSIRQSVGSAGKFLLAHVPAGMKWSGNGTASGAGGQQDTFFSETMRRPPAGIYQADLVL